MSYIKSNMIWVFKFLIFLSRFWYAKKKSLHPLALRSELYQWTVAGLSIKLQSFSQANCCKTLETPRNTCSVVTWKKKTSDDWKKNMQQSDLACLLKKEPFRSYTVYTFWWSSTDPGEQWKKLGCLGYIGDEQLPRSMGIIIKPV